MPSQKKLQVVADLQDKISKSKSVVFAKYTGLSVAQQTELRAKVKEAGGEITIARNRLVNVALGKPAGLADMLQDQLFTLFSYEDAVGAIKALYAFIEDKGVVEVKGGYFEDKVIDTKQVDVLSKIPGRNELMAMLLRNLQGPAYGLRGSLANGAERLSWALKAVADKKQQEA